MINFSQPKDKVVSFVMRLSPDRAAYYQLKNPQEEDVRPKHRAGVRTALRTMLVHGRSYQLSRPDDEQLIWHGDLCWHHSDEREPRCEEFDWLIDYLAGDAEHCTDNDTEGDALLVLSAMHGLGSSVKRRSYISSLIRCMHSTRPPRVRHTALRAVFEAREELASMTSASMPPGVDARLLNELSRSLLTAVRPKNSQITHDTGPDASFHIDRDSCYIRIICALMKNNEWYQRLTRDGHLDRCISLLDGLYQYCHLNAGFYLLVIFGRIKSSGKDLPFGPAQERWRRFITHIWNFVQRSVSFNGDVDGIPAFVAATRLNLTAADDGVPWEWLADLSTKVHGALVNLRQSQAYYVDRGIAQAAINGALSSIQGLDDELSRMVE
ncbi:uncharacterized protein BJ212DRAFT_868562 [Suillus subaureus]|uniref:Uncharacterized protein n=1 Tax=Suillus subaureus TaxID=48587 RepID=A0A9P7DX70_9AGAM|nr:uncharacterized protein BJ212DRAFT_868562 [Suillus subaureus]KAG1805470.1 hypothetical protein BJ212DRAFT_868562 [Suillus subaureus]